jgi:hypothetical protein
MISFLDVFDSVREDSGFFGEIDVDFELAGDDKDN